MDRITTTGWLILDQEDLHPIDFIIDDQPSQEAPISNDTGILQFHLEISFDGEYPTASIIE